MKILSKLDNTGMIEEVADKRYVTDAEKLTWNSKSDTDTITTINGKTGAISKADITALGIPAQDTVYSHPSSHPASMITGLPNSLPADGGNADTVGGFTVGTNVPADAVFTDTKTTINGKTGVIVKNDIVALGILAQGTELQLGNFKFVFNEVENSLDVEVLA